MMDRMLYVLAGYDAATDARLAGMQRALYARGFAGTQTRDIPQHITLGAFAPAMEDELARRLTAEAQSTAGFPVTLSHIGLFAGGRVLFIAPDCSCELLELAGRFGGGPGWTPHTTMLIDRPAVVLDALPTLVDAFAPLTGHVSALHLYEFFPARHVLTVELHPPAGR